MFRVVPLHRGKVFILCLLSLLGLRTYATHIVGGELYYRYLGSDNYEITLIVYRDCYTGVPPFDDPASIGIYGNPFNNPIDTLYLSPLDSLTVPPAISSPCLIPPTNICYRKATYRDTVNLPPSFAGYWLVYQRCCRNITIQNIIMPQDRGATYTAFIPGSATYSQNSNPVFDSLPAPFICHNIPFVFQHTATDFEGDSIVYELCTPLDYDGLTFTPMPQPPFPPPYADIPWRPPYSLANILGGVPMSIDPVTGTLTCTPSTTGQFVYGVCAREYRNGVYLSTTRRDFQVNVVPCPGIVVAALLNPILNCDDNSVTFQNQSINASSFRWDFGDPTTLADTSHAISPVYTYPDTGIYIVQLIAYSSSNEDCNDTTTGYVYVYPGFSINATAVTQPCSPEVQFYDSTASIYNTASWNWNFDDNTASSQHNPLHTFPGPGIYEVVLVAVSDKGCQDTVRLDVDLNYISAVVALAQPVDCFGNCNGIASAATITGIQPFTFQWDDPLNQNTLTADSLCEGTYTITIVDSAGCTDTVSVIIDEPPLLQASTAALTDYCNNACIGYGTATPIGGNGGYIYSWSDPQQQTTQTASSLCTGMYYVTVTDFKGCSVSDSIFIPYIDSLPVLDASAVEDTLYRGQHTTLLSTIGSGYTYHWTPAGTLSAANIPEPVATPVVTTDYIIEVTDSNGCRVADTVTVWVRDILCMEPEIFVPNAFTPNGDNENDILKVRGNTIEKIYFAIYDRWGEKIFETEKQETGWDGIYKGKKVHPGVFVYYLKATCYDQSELETKGNITVLR